MQEFFACGSKTCVAPSEIRGEGGAAAWLEGPLAAPSVQGHGLPLPQESWPYQGVLLSVL